MAEVRPQLSNPAYGASHTFVEDWRTHRVWDYLNGNYWKFIPTDERLLELQVGVLSRSSSRQCAFVGTGSTA
jgi:hypothetical protein